MTFDECLEIIGTLGVAKLLQRAANNFGAKLRVDGKIGPKSLTALKALDPLKLLAAFSCERLFFYEAHEDFEVFGRGWSMRLFKICAFGYHLRLGI